MNDAPAGKEEDILTTVARTIGSTLGTVAAKVNAVSSPSPRKRATPKRRPRAKAAKKKRPGKESQGLKEPAQPQTRRSQKIKALGIFRPARTRRSDDARSSRLRYSNSYFLGIYCRTFDSAL